MQLELKNMKLQLSLNRIIYRSLLLGAITTTGWLTSFVPLASAETLSTEPSVIAQIQDIPNEEITNYARIVLAMEPRRVQAFREIKDRVGGSVPRVVCNETRKINDLPGNIRGIAVNYCEQAKKLIESYNLTVARFNEITQRVQADPNFKQKVQAELVRLQQAPN